MSKEAAYHRYLTFSRVTFNAAPKELWPRLYADLLEFEDTLVFGLGHIGQVNVPFTFKVLDDRPIWEKAIPYPRAKCLWIH